MKVKKLILILLIVFFTAVLVCVIFGIDNDLCVKHYEIESPKISSPVRIALVTDLHSCSYGEGQHILTDAIDAEKPDILLLGGDIFDDILDNTNTDAFLLAVHDRYPCYYVTGNHEYRSGMQAFEESMKKLGEYGVTVLSDRSETIELNGQTLCLCGVDDPDRQYFHPGSSFVKSVADVKASAPNNTFTLLLSHRPEYFALYCREGFDLALCGHAHGGQWRIPGIMNGLIAPNQGLFPRYAGGLYEQGGTTMVVSRGLAKESVPVPRLYNPPELVIIDIK